MSHPLTLPFFHSSLSYRLKRPSSQHLVPEVQLGPAFTSDLLLCVSVLSVYPSQSSSPCCTKLHNSSVYLASCCPVGWNVTVVLAPQTHINTHTHKHAALFWFLSSVCLLLFSLCTLLWSLDSSASVLSQPSQPQGTEWIKGRWVKGGETERQFESIKRERRRGWGRTSLSAVVALFSSSEQSGRVRGKEGRERGQSLLHLFYSCCWHTCDISVWPLEHGRLQCLEKGKWHCTAPWIYPPPTNPSPTIICVPIILHLDVP